VKDRKLNARVCLAGGAVSSSFAEQHGAGTRPYLPLVPPMSCPRPEHYWYLATSKSKAIMDTTNASTRQGDNTQFCQTQCGSRQSNSMRF
jgi:hypothetical protein